MVLFSLMAVDRLDEVHRRAEAVVLDPPADPAMVTIGAGASAQRHYPNILAAYGYTLAARGDLQRGIEAEHEAVRVLRKDGRPTAPELVDLRNYMTSYHSNYGLMSFCLIFAARVYFLSGDLERSTTLAGRFEDLSPDNEFRAHATALAMRLRREWHGLADICRDDEPIHSVTRYRFALWVVGRARIGDPSALENARALIDRYPKAPDVAANAAQALALLRAPEDEVSAALAAAEAALRENGAAGYQPFIHEARAQDALLRGRSEILEREVEAAQRLWTAMGANGHVQRMKDELTELRVATEAH